MQKRLPREQFRHRTMSAFVLVYVIRGSGTYFDPLGQAHRVVAGDAIPMHANQPHGLVPDPDGEWAEAFLVVDSVSADAISAMGALDPSRLLQKPGVDVSIIDLFDRLVDEVTLASDDRMPLLAARVHEILAILLLRDRRDEHLVRTNMIEQACRLISQMPARKPSLEPLLSEHGISYERFRKIFRQHVGQSPNEYRIRRRIDVARAMLMQQRASVKQIAYALGYPDPFSFSRQFKQVVGVSPQQFFRADGMPDNRGVPSQQGRHPLPELAN